MSRTNRLTRVWRTKGTTSTGDDETLLEVAYDALSRRIESMEHVDEGGGTYTTPKRTWHVYAGFEPIMELEVADAGGGSLTTSLAREFVWGSAFPEPVYMVDHTAAGDTPAPGTTGGGPEVLHYVHDPLGSVLGLFNTNGVLVEQYVYDPYGRTYVEDASGSPRASSHYANPWRWTGQRFDGSTHQYHFTFRTYSPTAGRWLERDPLGYIDGVSLYQYAFNSPLCWIDPLGLEGGFWSRLGHSIGRIAVGAATGALGGAISGGIAGTLTPPINFPAGTLAGAGAGAVAGAVAGGISQALSEISSNEPQTYTGAALEGVKSGLIAGVVPGAVAAADAAGVAVSVTTTSLRVRAEIK